MPQPTRPISLFAPARAVGFNTAYMGAVLDTLELAEKSANVIEYGAVGDGVADDTAAFRRAIDALAGGGVVRVPVGWYRVTDEIRLHAGISIQGSNSVDFVYGDPPAATATPSFIFQATPGKAIFTIGGGQSHIRFQDISLSASRHPTLTPKSDGRTGVRIEGSWPSHVFVIVFDRVSFYDLHYGIYCTDPKAGGSAPDWSIAPVSVRDCQFYYPRVGVYVNSNNADGWVFDRTGFFIPDNGDGVYLHRFGLMRFVSTGGGGLRVANNRFLRIRGNGRFSVENIVLDGVQVETLANFIWLEPSGTYGSFPLNIMMRECITEMGADIYLGNQCRLTSQNTRYSANVIVDHGAVKLSSINDRFDNGASFRFRKGDAATSFEYLLPGPDTAAAYENTTYLNGVRSSRGTRPPTSGASRIGDMVYNAEPAAGRPLGWVCTAAGNPGKWNPFGAIGS